MSRIWCVTHHHKTPEISSARPLKMVLIYRSEKILLSSAQTFLQKVLRGLSDGKMVLIYRKVLVLLLLGRALKACENNAK